MLPLEQGQPFDVFVVVLDAISERRGDCLDIALDLFVELLVVDDHAAEVLGELFPDDPHCRFGLSVEQRRGLGRLRELLDVVPLSEEASHVGLNLLGSDVLGRRSNDHTVLFRLGLVENVAEAFAFTVGQPLGDAVGRTVRHEHDEPARERDLLGETGTLVGDRVLGDLGENRLLGLEDVLDTGLLSASLLALASAIEIIGVVLDIAGIEHGVLGRGDVDERGFHAGQDVLDPSEVDVAVDLADVVGRTRDLMLDQFASLEGCDLGGLGADMDTHEITADGLALAGATTPTLQRLFVKFDRVAGCDGLDGYRTAALPLLATSVVLVLTILALAAATLAATATTTATAPASTLLGLAVTALVLCAIAAVLAILVALIAIAAIALWGGAGIADLGGRTAVADLRLGLRGGRASLTCASAALAAGGVVLGLFVGHSVRLSS